MSETLQKFQTTPIIEAVLDIECDIPGDFNPELIQKHATELVEDYPVINTQYAQEFVFTVSDESSSRNVAKSPAAVQFRTPDKLQLVQFRKGGYSFNRLAPYRGLDSYLPEIDRTWQIYRRVVNPVQVTALRLRYINRLLLPAQDGQLSLSDYLKISPQLPSPANLMFTGFFNQHTAVEAGTGNAATILLVSEPGNETQYPIVFDITVAKAAGVDPSDWAWILSQIGSLRILKNRIFEHTLTEKCLNLYQH